MDQQKLNTHISLSKEESHLILIMPCWITKNFFPSLTPLSLSSMFFFHSSIGSKHYRSFLISISCSPTAIHHSLFAFLFLTVLFHSYLVTSAFSHLSDITLYFPDTVTTMKLSFSSCFILFHPQIITLSIVLAFALSRELLFSVSAARAD